MLLNAHVHLSTFLLLFSACTYASKKKLKWTIRKESFIFKPFYSFYNIYNLSEVIMQIK